ncbi:1-(5-phosphoribosyl)-5-[(5-phosphoribosylamino)methylideneamino] imidazole-4-carboxamide isomerase [Tistlia consotensis]|uniref:1-(5-phosphoribosyl)-5-[(5-phosphoribosylamino)methylideneamino] imidazole-4-carboxamide isomerase n=1 Tax=Tistlia consotensis USBA 355 TaxID=560819 RepID=A0A1Y6BGL9_9PROT|nr:1-(5-phosphoribosyl)-5-[(5-phosphoribosylamino)methylideneamino]imidazole-4-carboxamide isomerase [Tistlia consotensis]SMF08816.1 1-(5-phosphoribosyl)-5-[(5-phosphoribosylamino)methylideneamino] imidazole-4-carboxamide isomerase [Tistlia consotensis USBA 355]SNR35127.1 1-(5-phosphoribosyl)-5-[(5-phosphoribosylamino)methylideneamino] imidazole-4-carboxamide isomerase [Tistlia consotensis]
MILFPAIDLKDNQVVRLRLGEMDQATIFNSDPVAQAEAFAKAGFEWLHVVDLNGAFAGRAVHEPVIESILSATRLPVQLGGGIRSMERIERWLEIGVNRVILGTVAVKDPQLVREACRRFPGRIVVGVDAKGGRVAVEGWAEVSDLAAPELAKRFEDAGVTALLYTDIDRDGLLAGVNVDSTVALARATRLPVIASGGVASLDDIAELMAYEEDGICGVVCGRALYDGRIDPAEALALLAGGEV